MGKPVPGGRDRRAAACYHNDFGTGRRLRVVGVPNPVTAPLQLDADLMLPSLAAMLLEEMLRRVEGESAHGTGGRASGPGAHAEER
ncbi:MAG TPA: hypothetical protein VFH29_01420 [Anaerolineales bacterium]|nr:hypothetical protein [Anaerolineales bacterium]